MALYYFDSREGPHFIRDDIGVELPDMAAVEKEAAVAAADIARDKLPKDTSTIVVIEVRDEHDRRIVTAAATLLVCRH